MPRMPDIYGCVLQGPDMTAVFSRSLVGMAALVAGLSLSTPASHAQTLTAPPVRTPTETPPAPASNSVANSFMNGQLFYQILVGEMQLRHAPGYSYQIFMELARKYDNTQLYERAVQIALQARAGQQALDAAQAWSKAKPFDRKAAEYEARILMALARPEDMVAPLQKLIRLTPSEQQATSLLVLPRSLLAIPDRQQAARIIDKVTEPWRSKDTDIAEAWVASGEGRFMAGDTAQALQYLQTAHAKFPNVAAVGLLAIALIPSAPEAEPIAIDTIKRQDSPLLRLAYARRLLSIKREAEAIVYLQQVIAAQAENADAWLALGSAQLVTGQLDDATQSTQRYIALAEATQTQETAAELSPSAAANSGPMAGYLKMAQISERKKDLVEADKWLAKADPNGDQLNVQIIRGQLLAAQGKLPQARQLIQAIKESEPRDGLKKTMAEADLLRKTNDPQGVYDVLSQGYARFPDDPDLIYSLGMAADTLTRHDESEQLLRKLIALQPEEASPYNALGYSLADRGTKLPEARALLEKAMALKPNDAAITDSMGWLAYREGKLEDALKLLQQAHNLLPEPEIAAHLGEVMWKLTKHDEAKQVWREALKADPANAVLQETLKRLQVNDL
jgi:tetratricopeptide (TPR) repeat protein